MRVPRIQVSIAHLACVITMFAVLSAVAVQWRSRVASESAFIEFQNLGFEYYFDGHTKASLVYSSPTRLFISYRLVPHVRSLRGIDRVVSGNCTLSQEVTRLLEQKEIEVE